MSELTSEQIDLLNRTLLLEASATEREMFVQQCNRTGLDPFNRQIYPVMRWDGRQSRNVMQTQISIDGARLVAQRSHEYAGQTAVYWCGADRQWTDLWLPEDGEPKAAKVGVYRQGFVEPLWAVAVWDSYAVYNKGKDGKARLSQMWAKMPGLMLGKCAEALALRKAFPMELSGLYTNDEMGQQDNDLPAPAPSPKSSSRAPKPEPTSAPVVRSAPRHDESDPATPEQIDELKASIAMLDDVDRARLVRQWEDANIPPVAHLSKPQAVQAQGLVNALLNAVDTSDVPDSAPDGRPWGDDQFEPEPDDDLRPPVTAPPVAPRATGHPANDGAPRSNLATEKQVGFIHKLLADVGVADADRHDELAAILGKPVTSTKALTKGEAKKVIDSLIARQDG